MRGETYLISNHISNALDSIRLEIIPLNYCYIELLRGPSEKKFVENGNHHTRRVSMYGFPIQPVPCCSGCHSLFQLNLSAQVDSSEDMNATATHEILTIDQFISNCTLSQSPKRSTYIISLVKMSSLGQSECQPPRTMTNEIKTYWQMTIATSTRNDLCERCNKITNGKWSTQIATNVQRLLGRA